MMKLRCDYLSIYLLSLFILSIHVSANAAYQRGYLNLGFETPTTATVVMFVVHILVAHVPGWLTTHPAAMKRFSGTCSISTNGSGQLMEMGRAKKY